jgi:Ca-activated chloride channel homolog
MRLSLVLLVMAALLTGLTVSGTRAQTSRRSVESRVQQGAVKICRGVPVPDGYIVVAEATSRRCPDGAYVIKRERAASTPGSTPAEPQAAPVAFRPRRVTVEAVTDSGGARARADGGPPVLVGSTTNATTSPPSQARAPASDSAGLEVGDGDVVRVDTNLVTVPVSVFDRQGRAVTGLRRDDFRIFENGVEQEVAYFEPTERPFTVALLLDTSASTRFRLSEIKESAIAFARQLQPQDRVLVVTFNSEVLLLTEATNDQDIIRGAITANARTGGSTRLYDAVDLIVKERLKNIQGRKAIVLFTDGVDTSSFLADYESTVREVDEFDAMIFTIKYDTFEDVSAATGGSVTVTTGGSGWPFHVRSRPSGVIYNLPSAGPAPPGFTRADYERGGRYLSELAEKTGGQLYNADDPRQLAQAFSNIAEELRRQYSLGYYPKGSAADAGERRQIRVRVRQPGLAVRARDGYVAAPAAR